MKFKHSPLLALFAILMLVLSACGGATTPAAEAPTAAPAAAPAAEAPTAAPAAEAATAAPAAAPAVAPTAAVEFPQEATADQKTIVWMVRTDNPPELPWEKDIVLPAYQKANPKVFVKVLAIVQKDITVKREAMIAAKEPLHVWTTNWGGDGFASDRARGLITDLTPLIERDKVDMSDFLPDVLKIYQSEGKQWGIPFLTTGSYVYYNKKLFQAAGIPDLPTSWDDTSWTVADAPPIPHARLNDVSGSSASDVWAVGSVGGFHGGSLIEHWNGATWSVVRSPRLPEADYLTSVVSLTPNDAWAVGAWWMGGTGGAGHYTALVERWDGVRWVAVNAPPSAPALVSRHSREEGIELLSSPASLLSVEPGDEILTSVDASSSEDVWVGGSTVGKATGPYRQFVARWNGHGWWSSMSPGNGTMSSISVVSSEEAWAFVNQNGPRMAIEHWSHGEWAPVSAPSLGRNLAGGSVAVGPRDAWMVGQRQGSRNSPLIEHWNGTRWRMVPSPPIHAILNGVVVTPSGSVVAVGSTTTNGPQRTVIVDGC